MQVIVQKIAAIIQENAIHLNKNLHHRPRTSSNTYTKTIQAFNPKNARYQLNKKYKLSTKKYKSVQKMRVIQEFVQRIRVIDQKISVMSKKCELSIKTMHQPKTCQSSNIKCELSAKKNMQIMHKKCKSSPKTIHQPKHACYQPKNANYLKMQIIVRSILCDTVQNYTTCTTIITTITTLSLFLSAHNVFVSDNAC